MDSAVVPFRYLLKRTAERFGDFALTVECLQNLDQTIDALFDYLKVDGRESLLETLCPYFGVVWPSARALCAELVDRREGLVGRTLLELGCGLAIPSMLASKLGARATATDFHPEVPRFLERNQALNAAADLAYVPLDWQKMRSSDELGQFDWVVGSDILYERQQPAIVADAIASHLAPQGIAIVADPARPYLQSFVDEMKARGFTYETLVRSAQDIPVNKDIFVMAFRRGLA